MPIKKAVVRAMDVTIAEPKSKDCPMPKNKRKKLFTSCGSLENTDLWQR